MLCDCALGALPAAQGMVEELLYTWKQAWAHPTATGSVLLMQTPTESEAKAEMHIVYLPMCCSGVRRRSECLKVSSTTRKRPAPLQEHSAMRTWEWRVRWWRSSAIFAVLGSAYLYKDHQNKDKDSCQINYLAKDRRNEDQGRCN